MTTGTVAVPEDDGRREVIPGMPWDEAGENRLAQDSQTKNAARRILLMFTASWG